jgi:hypothetical protein
VLELPSSARPREGAVNAWWLRLMRWVCLVLGHEVYTVWTPVMDHRGSFSHRAYVKTCARCDWSGECPPFITVKVGRDADR